MAMKKMHRLPRKKLSAPLASEKNNSCNNQFFHPPPPSKVKWSTPNRPLGFTPGFTLILFKITLAKKFSFFKKKCARFLNVSSFSFCNIYIHLFCETQQSEQTITHSHRIKGKFLLNGETNGSLRIRFLTPAQNS